MTKELGQDMTDAEVDEFIQEADRDGDGDIDKDEFLAYFQSRQI